MKKALAILLAVIMVFGLVACGGTTETTPAGTSTPASTTPASSGGAAATTGGTEAPADAAPAQLTAWEEASGIYNTDDTDEDLYQAALAEGGEITLYSISSRCGKVADAFMAKYPGLTVTAVDISTNELLEKVTREYQAGTPTADVVHIKDQDGSMYLEYVANKIFYNYKPADILAHIDPAYYATSTPLYIELTQLFYNTEVYEESPVTNIWQLTEPQWKGKIVMQNPLDNLSWGSWITGFCVGDEPDRLAAAYKELYGTDLVLSAGCENAGYEFLKRLHDNNPTYMASSDACAEAVGAPGQSDPPIGFSASSKLRKAADNGWMLQSVNLYPDTGIPAVNTLYIVEGSQHSAGAKLLVRFMMGGVDGDISGYKPFNTLGGWPVRDDIEPAAGSTPFSEMNVANFDANEIYVNYNLVRDFWQMLG